MSFYLLETVLEQRWNVQQERDFIHTPIPLMRNTDPHREYVENILAICFDHATRQGIFISQPCYEHMCISAWNEQWFGDTDLVGNHTYIGKKETTETT